MKNHYNNPATGTYLVVKSAIMSARPFALLLCILIVSNAFSRQTTDPAKTPALTVTAYYTGSADEIEQYRVDKLTHIIFSFCYLKNGRLVTGSAAAGKTIKKLVSLKKKYPNLKILLSLGGWGGCKDCSETFTTKAGRVLFAQSTKAMIQQYGADGIDLDWEYPAIEGHPGHSYKPADRPNFTELVKTLRSTLGKDLEISFAAGGFTKFLRESVEWTKLMPYLDRVNMMTYDLINGYSTITGHHTALYSTPDQVESTDNAIRFLDSIGVPRNKVVIGTAFYARVFEGADSLNNGLNRPAKFNSFVPYKNFLRDFTEANGFKTYWDNTAQAPYSYHPGKKLFATYDNPRSIALKTRYALDKGLNGLMFWELTLDKTSDGLLNDIDKERKGN